MTGMSIVQRSGCKKVRTYVMVVCYSFSCTKLFFQIQHYHQDAVDIDKGGNGWNCEVMWRAQAAVLIAVADRWEDVRRYHN